MTSPASPRGTRRAERASGADDRPDHDPLDAEAALWAARLHDGLSREEEAELQAWLAGAPARADRLAEVQGLEQRLDDLPADDRAALRAAVRPATAGRGAVGLPPRAGRRVWPGALLAGLAVALVVGGWQGWVHWQAQPTFVRTYATERGQQLSARLPDGSSLRLDTASRLEVVLYRQRREVRLAQGRAFFEVSRDGTRPFEVQAGAVRVTVLGTRFSVRHTTDGPAAGSVQVAVEEGRVRVARPGVDGAVSSAGAGGSAGLDLGAGQSVVAEAGGTVRPLPVAIDATLAWREGRLVLDGTPLAEALAEFERYVDTGLVISDPAVAALRLNGSFDVREVGAFRRSLTQVLPVRLKPRDDGRMEVVGLR